jgi:hypothetical protein
MFAHNDSSIEVHVTYPIVLCHVNYDFHFQDEWIWKELRAQVEQAWVIAAFNWISFAHKKHGETGRGVHSHPTCNNKFTTLACKTGFPSVAAARNFTSLMTRINFLV